MGNAFAINWLVVIADSCKLRILTHVEASKMHQMIGSEKGLMSQTKVCTDIRLSRVKLEKSKRGVFCQGLETPMQGLKTSNDVCGPEQGLK